MKLEFDVQDREQCEVVYQMLAARLNPELIATGNPQLATYATGEQPVDEPPRKRKGRPKKKPTPKTVVETAEIVTAPVEETPSEPKPPTKKQTAAAELRRRKAREALGNVISHKELGPAAGTELLHSFTLQEGSIAFTELSDPKLADIAKDAKVGDPARVFSFLTAEQWPELEKQAKALVKEATS